MYQIVLFLALAASSVSNDVTLSLGGRIMMSEDWPFPPPESEGEIPIHDDAFEHECLKRINVIFSAHRVELGSIATTKNERFGNVCRVKFRDIGDSGRLEGKWNIAIVWVGSDGNFAEMLKFN